MELRRWKTTPRFPLIVNFFWIERKCVRLTNELMVSQKHRGVFDLSRDTTTLLKSLFIRNILYYYRQYFVILGQDLDSISITSVVLVEKRDRVVFTFLY